MGSATASGDNRAIQAVETALASPLLNDNNIKGARYILMNIASGSSEVTMDEIGSITDYIQDEAGLTADIIWGNCYDETLEDRISVTIIATGFKTKAEQGMEAERTRKTVHQLDKEDSPISEKNQIKKPQWQDEIRDASPESTEPVLIRKDEPSIIKASASEEITFEFNLSGNSPIENTDDASTGNEQESAPARQEKTTHSIENKGKAGDQMEEQLRKSRERVQKLKALNYRMGPNANITDMEKVPAYVRKEIKLDNVPHSSESQVSRYTLSNEEEKKPELRQNNSFLHDNVD
jgi:cell division protein FtsZ